MSFIKALFIGLICLFFAGCSSEKQQESPVQISGIYPHLAYYNMEGECGGGAVVPWADRLWLVTYGPHLPFGSSDKLYEITPDMKQIVRKESVGGTPANRMIHNESNQLFIGPYVIDNQRNVRAIPYTEAPGRYTGNARHLSDPAEKVYIGTMEEGFYEVDVKTLKTKMLYPDGNVNNEKEDDVAVNQNVTLLPGAHGKGLYSGQGVLVYSNNGEASEEALSKFDIEAGVLAEWNGKEWKVIRRSQFMEVSGPGGISGNKNPETDPIWTSGFDFKSVLVGVRDNGKWTFYRLPKASHSYDGAHGWNTEWPRIRNIGTVDSSDYLMTMHGMFWRFPGSFTSENSVGIRPRSAYLKVIGDFTRWNNTLVFSCDDSGQKEFLNKRKAKGNIGGPGQSNSNLWFTSLSQPDNLGPGTAEGAVWLRDKVNAGVASEPFLFAGWERRCAWVQNENNKAVTFTFETDEAGNGSWKILRKVIVGSGEAVCVEFDKDTPGEWIRAIADKTTTATLHFSYAENDQRSGKSDEIFAGLSKVSESGTKAGLLWGLGQNRRKLGILAGSVSDDTFTESGYYELDSLMNLVKKEDPETASFIRKEFAIPQQVVTVDEASVLIVDDNGRRWRLPKGDPKYAGLANNALLRVCREVATERDLLNCSGTFYELPAENADGFAKIRPVASHNLRIHDYASYRGMLIMTGIEPEISGNNSHVILSKDGKAAVWAGVIDDLWKLGKPVGKGGPWKNTLVVAGEPSDPYLIGFYDRRSLSLSHNDSKAVSFKIEVEPVGHGPWMAYKEVNVDPGQIFRFTFPDNFQSRWIRFTSGKNCEATAWLDYE